MGQAILVHGDTRSAAEADFRAPPLGTRTTTAAVSTVLPFDTARRRGKERAALSTMAIETERKAVRSPYGPKNRDSAQRGSRIDR
jgi:hypothetical protein